MRVTLAESTANSIVEWYQLQRYLPLGTCHQFFLCAMIECGSRRSLGSPTEWHTCPPDQGCRDPPEPAYSQTSDEIPLRSDRTVASVPVCQEMPPTPHVPPFLFSLVIGSGCTVTLVSEVSTPSRCTCGPSCSWKNIPNLRTQSCVHPCS